MSPRQPPAATTGLLLGLAGLAAAGLVAAAGRPAQGLAVGAAEALGHRAHLPLAWRGVALAELAQPPTAAATRVPTVTGTATPPAATATPPAITATARPSATEPPPSATATEAATPTTAAHTGRIHGRFTDNGQPLSAGYGAEGLPQIELHRCAGPDCERVAHTQSLEGGLFEFLDPPALEAGQTYQVWWVNDPGLSYDGFLYRWWSRKVTAFGGGEEVDLGTMEIADLKLGNPCHDCGQTLPITFKWTVRDNPREVYRWSLMKQCGNYGDRANAYQTQALAHRSEYTLSSPPPGFRIGEKYCWFIHIEDGQNGTGSSYYHWRVTFLPQP